MKNLFLLLGVCAVVIPLSAQVTTEHIVFGLAGTSSIHAGSSGWTEVSHAWIDRLPFTVDTVLNTVIVPGHPYKNGTILRFYTEGALPYPINQMRSYVACDVTADSFRLVPYSYACTSAKLDFTTTGTGFLRVGTPRIGKTNIYVTSVTGFPAGVTAELWCEHFPCLSDGRLFVPQGGYQINLKFTASAAAAQGPATIRVVLEPVGEPVKVVNIPLTVNPAPITPWVGAPVAPMPSKALWETFMKTIGAKWCNLQNPVDPMYFGVENQVWFYDGAEVYARIAEYTKNPLWIGFADNIARQYRDYIMSNNGMAPGWRVFPRGLESAYRRTGDVTYLNAIQAMVDRGWGWLVGGSFKDEYMRETAYYLSSQTALERLKRVRPPKMVKTAELLMGMLDSDFVSNRYIYQQIFMDGLAFRSLIEYYSLTRDPRVPPAIKKGLDWIWTNAWIPSTRKLMVNPDPLGPRCEWGCQQGNSDLINLTAPAYAWYWSITRDPVYQARGDEMWNNSLATDITYSGKIFSQNFTWSFDYVKWRNPALSPTGFDEEPTEPTSPQP